MSIPRHLALWFALALVPVGALAHPGPVDAEGCHVCRTRCARYGIGAGERHCHPERARGGGSPRNGAEDVVQPGGGEDAGGEEPFSRPRRVVRVVAVADGDTLTIQDSRGRQKVRVLGIDCPESHRNAKCRRDGRQGRKGCDWQVPRGIEAARQARGMLEGQTVTLEGPYSRDPYGRLLAYVRLADGTDFGEWMVRQGYCEDFGWKYPHPRSGRYRSLAPGAGGTVPPR